MDDIIEDIIVTELNAGRRIDFVLGEVFACQQATLVAGWERLARLAGVNDRNQFLLGYEYRKTINGEIERLKNANKRRTAQASH